MINVDEKIKEALLNKNEVATKVYRAIKAEILKFKTQKNAPEYNDQEEISLLSKMSKRYDESIEAFVRGHRDDLANSERAEKEIIDSLLPKAVDRDSMEFILKTYVESKYENTIIPKKEMGLAVKYMKSMCPMNDGKEIADLVKSYIN